MRTRYFVVPERAHNALIGEAFSRKGFEASEVGDIVRACADAARHGIRTHHGLKALHLDHLFGSSKGGCVPRAKIEEMPSRFKATQVWDAHRKAGPPVAYQAIERCIELAEQFGIAMVNVDNAFHYFWGGAYVLEAARRGYIAYTQCTALLAEVVPHGGRTPTLGTNPHTWGFPTNEIVGFPILVDFATSGVAMGRVQQLLREGQRLPAGMALDAEGRPTEDPAQVAALLPFGAHKGYGLGLVNELMAAYTGGHLPTVRGRPRTGAKKNTTCFQFVVIHPDAMRGGELADRKAVDQNVKEVIGDVLGNGNESCLLPGEIEAKVAARCAAAGGLLFTEVETNAFGDIARGLGMEWVVENFGTVEI